MYGRYICNKCFGYCDAGELQNGICDECREAIAKSEEMEKKRAALLMTEPDGQMVIIS